MSVSNALLLTQVLMQVIEKAQQVTALLQTAAAEGRDLLDEEVDASGLRADAELAKLQLKIT